LTNLASLRDPRCLQVVEVVENKPRNRQRPQILDAGCFRSAELGVFRLIAPGNESRKATHLVLELSQPEQVFQSLLHRLDRAVHHRRCRTKAGTMRVPHHIKPFIRRGFVVAIEKLAHAIDKNLRAAAWHAVEPCGNQALENLRDRQARRPRDMDNLRR